MKTGLSLYDYYLKDTFIKTPFGYYIITLGDLESKETNIKEPPLRKRVPSQPQYKRRW